MIPLHACDASRHSGLARPNLVMAANKGRKRSRISAGIIGIEPKTKRECRVKHHGIGAITKIELQDFMCHEHLVYHPGPCVNLITGRNGSGKSSIFQAIVLGLGGTSKQAERGYKNLSRFVRQGADKAVIKITLQNSHPDPNWKRDLFKVDKYGDKIICERTISPIQSSFLLRSSNGEVRLRGGKRLAQSKSSTVSLIKIAF